MSALTDSFPPSHITHHLLSTYPVFKAIFSSDGRNVACIKVKSQSHLPIHSLNEKPQLNPPYSSVTPRSREPSLEWTTFLSELHVCHDEVCANFDMNI